MPIGVHCLPLILACRRRLTGKANKPKTTPPTVPVRKPSFFSSRSNPHLRATWLGHACWLVEFGSGIRVLFDPVFTPRCSPFSWLGPKRYTEIPCQIKDIPIIDMVVISHNHYDHLSYPTVLAIKKTNPDAHFFVPLGNKAWFEQCGIHDVTELDWWESREAQISFAGQNNLSDADFKESEVSNGNIAEAVATIHCTPCQHMTARSGLDRARTLWASWCVESNGKKVWFAGDTGYRAVPERAEGQDDYAGEYADLPHCPAFAQIGEHRGPFDLGLIPIGAYMPRWIMSPMHANPFDSVNMFRDTKCKRALGMHWGTWVLTEEDVLEPPKLLKEALKKSDYPQEGIFDTCGIGETLEF